MPRLRLRIGPFLAIVGFASAQIGPGNSVCASCHRSIYDSYITTPMARSARQVDLTTAAERFDRASFDASGFHYQVDRQNGGAVLSFEKTNSELRGSANLAYAVGS